MSKHKGIPPAFGGAEWFEAQIAQQERDADKLRTLLLATSAVMAGLGLRLAGIDVVAEGGRARGRILGMLEARDMVSVNALAVHRDPEVIVEIDGLTIRQSDARERNHR